MPKVYRLTELAGPRALRLFDEDRPQPGKGEVLLRMRSAGLNRAEWLFTHGRYLVAPQLPSRLGVEGAGTIEAVGAGVSGYEVGQDVCVTPNMPFERYGVLGEYATAPVSALAEKPDNLSWEQAAAVWMAYPTAYGGLVYAGGLREQAGQTVLVSAASSSVGLPALQIAKAHGATVIATSRTLSKAAILKEYGADYVIATDDERWPSRVMDVTDGKGFDIAFDPIAGRFISQLGDAAAPGARIVCYGALSMSETPLPLFAAIAKGLTLSGFHVVFHLFQHPERLSQAKAISCRV